MFEINLNVDEFASRALAIEDAARQFPFAMSRSMNDAALKARRVLVEVTWPKHVKVYNRAFISRALRTRFSNKHNLEVAVYDDLGRDYLVRLAVGGSKGSRSGRNLTIPNPDNVRRTSRGTPANMRAKALIARTPKKAVRITPRGIFIAKGGKLRLFFSLKKQVSVPQLVPFYEDFEEVMNEGIRTGFDEFLAKAMRPRR